MEVLDGHMTLPPEQENKGTGSDAANSKADIAELDAKLRAYAKIQKQKYPEPADAGKRGTAIGMAFRLSTELVAGLVVGGVIGWLLDDWLGTEPWLLLIFFFLGAAAGIMNVFRTAQLMAAAATQEQDEPDTSSGDR